MQSPEENKPLVKPSVFTLGKTVALAVQFGFVIAIPLIGLGLLGKWLDAKTYHHNLFVLLGILLALISSTMVLTRRINEIRKEISNKTSG